MQACDRFPTPLQDASQLTRCHPLHTSGKMVFALDNFTSINVALWSYGRIESISGILYCYILGGNNLDTINSTTVALYCYILAMHNVDMIHSIYG